MEKTNDREKAVLVGVTTSKETPEVTQEHLNELSLLAHTAGADEKGRFTQRMTHPHPRTYVGPGKLQEIGEFVNRYNLDTAIFDDELSPSQIKNIEKELNVKVLDRNNLILDIFASSAKTAQAKTQVELAQYEYLLPRLTRMWTHLSRQKGGIGMKGPGEREIETDRRIIRKRISLLKQKLQQIDKQSITQRKRRGQKVRVALVGYTNAGKSTVMNLLSDADVSAEDKLFATLDTTVREVVVRDTSFLISDTVGFIRKLPHSLVESFKSTLDEVREADILMHVVDISHPQFEKQMQTVNDTLTELKAGGKPTLIVFNKIDRIQQKEQQENREEDGVETIEDKLEYLRKKWFSKDKNVRGVFISALKGINAKELKKELAEMVVDEYLTTYPFVPYKVYHG